MAVIRKKSLGSRSTTTSHHPWGLTSISAAVVASLVAGLVLVLLPTALTFLRKSGTDRDSATESGQVDVSLTSPVADPVVPERTSSHHPPGVPLGSLLNPPPSSLPAGPDQFYELLPDRCAGATVEAVAELPSGHRRALGTVSLADDAPDDTHVSVTLTADNGESDTRTISSAVAVSLAISIDGAQTATFRAKSLHGATEACSSSIFKIVLHQFRVH